MKLGQLWKALLTAMTFTAFGGAFAQTANEALFEAARSKESARRFKMAQMSMPKPNFGN